MAQTWAEDLLERGRQQGKEMAQTWAEELLEKGRQQGREMARARAEELLEKGRQQDREMAQARTEEMLEKGRVEAAQSMILGLLSEKFGSVPEETERKVRSLRSSAALERLARQLIHASTLEDLDL